MVWTLRRFWFNKLSSAFFKKQIFISRKYSAFLYWFILNMTKILKIWAWPSLIFLSTYFYNWLFNYFHEMIPNNHFFTTLYSYIITSTNSATIALVQFWCELFLRIFYIFFLKMFGLIEIATVIPPIILNQLISFPYLFFIVNA